MGILERAFRRGCGHGASPRCRAGRGAAPPVPPALPLVVAALLVTFGGGRDAHAQRAVVRIEATVVRPIPLLQVGADGLPHDRPEPPLGGTRADATGSLEGITVRWCGPAAPGAARPECVAPGGGRRGSPGETGGGGAATGRRPRAGWHVQVAATGV